MQLTQTWKTDTCAVSTEILVKYGIPVQSYLCLCFWFFPFTIHLFSNFNLCVCIWCIQPPGLFSCFFAVSQLQWWLIFAAFYIVIIDVCHRWWGWWNSDVTLGFRFWSNQRLVVYIACSVSLLWRKRGGRIIYKIFYDITMSSGLVPVMDKTSVAKG